MTTNNQMGTCALCGKENIQLMQSHLIPKAVYKRIKTFKNSRFREMDDIQKYIKMAKKSQCFVMTAKNFLVNMKEIFAIPF